MFSRLLAGVEVWSHVLVVGLDPLLDLLVKLAEAQANAAIHEELGDIDGICHR